MAWSYREDRADEVYHADGGPAIIEGEPTGGETPGGEMIHNEKLRKEKKKPVEGVLTQFQEYPGQNVPRVIEDEGQTEKDKKIVEAAAAREKAEKEGADDPALIDFRNTERQRIMVEEQNKADADELEKEREKIRKDVQAGIKKDTEPKAQHTNAKK